MGMTLSEAKNKFRVAKKLGLRRFMGIWDRTYNFGNNYYGRVSFTDYEILTAVDFPQLVRISYERLEHQAYERNRF